MALRTTCPRCGADAPVVIHRNGYYEIQQHRRTGSWTQPCFLYLREFMIAKIDPEQVRVVVPRGWDRRKHQKLGG